MPKIKNVKNNLIYFVVLSFLVCSSIYRIDLDFGLFSFRLTPPLFISFILCTICLIRMSMSLRIKKNLNFLLKYILILLFIITLSLFINSLKGVIYTLQLKRAILFSLILFSAFSFIYLFNELSSLKKYYILCKFINISLFVYICFCFIQILFFLKGKFILEQEKTFLYDFFCPYPQMISTVFPRLTGGFIDPNLAAYFLSSIFFLSIILEKNFSKFIAFILIILTLSRTGISGFLFGLILYKIVIIVSSNIKNKKINCSLLIKKIFAYATIGLIIGIICIQFYDIICEIIQLRLYTDLKSGSGKIHLQLILFSLSNIKNIINFFFGHGFNSSYIYAQKFFLNNKYANFHSEYITFLFEEGIVGLFAYLIIYFTIFHMISKKILNKNTLAILALIVSFMLFNILYQQFMFFYYWNALFLSLYLLTSKDVISAT